MGKSAVAAMFEELGVPVFDADAEVRRMQGPGGSAGRGDRGGVSRHDRTAGRRPRQRWAPRCSAKQRRWLGSRRSSTRRYARRARGSSRSNAGAPLVVFDIPLLFEKGGAEEVDAVLVVSAPPEVQRARVLARPGMTPERFAADPRAADARCRKARPRRLRDRHRRLRCAETAAAGQPRSWRSSPRVNPLQVPRTVR